MDVPLPAGNGTSLGLWPYASVKVIIYHPRERDKWVLSGDWRDLPPNWGLQQKRQTGHPAAIPLASFVLQR